MGYYLGIDLGGTNIAAGLVDGELQITERRSIKTRVGDTPDRIVEDLSGLISLMAKKAGRTPSELAGIGIGVPGSVNREGVVEDANNIRFSQVPLKQLLEERTGARVHIINDAKAAAYGEYAAGAGAGSDSFFMLTLGTGIGGAYIENGRIQEGCNLASGEVGHMVIEMNGIPCSCGRKGCFEVYASASALRRFAAEAAFAPKPAFVAEAAFTPESAFAAEPALTPNPAFAAESAFTPNPAFDRNPSFTAEPAFAGSDSLLYTLCDGNADKMNGEVFFRALGQGDKTAEQVFERYLTYLAAGVTNVINLLQPEILCIGGGISAQGERLLAPLRERVEEQVYSRSSRVQTRLTAAVLGNDAGIIGAALAAF